MENYSNKPGQSQAGQSGQTKTMEKDKNFSSTSYSSIESNLEEGVKGMAVDAQNKLQEGKEKASEFMCALNKQVRSNPWPVLAGVALGSFMLGSMMNKFSRK